MTSILSVARRLGLICSMLFGVSCSVNSSPEVILELPPRETVSSIETVGDIDVLMVKRIDSDLSVLDGSYFRSRLLLMRGGDVLDQVYLGRVFGKIALTDDNEVLVYQRKDLHRGGWGFRWVNVDGSSRELADIDTGAGSFTLTNEGELLLCTDTGKIYKQISTDEWEIQVLDAYFDDIRLSGVVNIGNGFVIRSSDRIYYVRELGGPPLWVLETEHPSFVFAVSGKLFATVNGDTAQLWQINPLDGQVISTYLFPPGSFAFQPAISWKRASILLLGEEREKWLYVFDGDSEEAGSGDLIALPPRTNYAVAREDYIIGSTTSGVIYRIPLK